MVVCRWDSRALIATSMVRMCPLLSLLFKAFTLALIRPWFRTIKIEEALLLCQCPKAILSSVQVMGKFKELKTFHKPISTNIKLPEIDSQTHLKMISSSISPRLVRIKEPSFSRLTMECPEETCSGLLNGKLLKIKMKNHSKIFR